MPELNALRMKMLSFHVWNKEMRYGIMNQNSPSAAPTVFSVIALVISALAFICAMLLILVIGGCSNAVETTPDRIGIIGAMEEEVTSLKEALTDTKTTTIAGMEFCEGKLEDKDVVVVQCGMGKVNAGICANTLINQFDCSRIINTGVAGSLNNQIDIGDIVVSVDACQHDFTVEKIGFEKGEIPYTGLSAFPADETMRKEAVEAVHVAAPDVQVFEGRVCTGDQFISSKEQKELIKSDFGGMCCEMEGGAIAQVCYLNDTPFVIIRAISDKADDSEEMNYEMFKKDAAEHCASVVRYMIIHMKE